MKVDYDYLPDCEPVPGSAKLIRLKADWYFTIDGKQYWIPVGYFYDGASIPRIFWILIGSPFEPDFWAAAMAHDWLYLMHWTSRPTADEVIYQLLRKGGVGTIRAHVIWAAVRSCAGLAWTNNTEDLQEIQKLKADVDSRPDHFKFGL
jgi:hypothetical protein